MTVNLKKFMEEISKDDTLLEKAKKADKAELLAMAKELNLELMEEDFMNPEIESLSEDELAAVAGGGGCGCAVGGIGEYDGIQCSCVVLGTGNTDLRTSYCTGAGKGMCICPAAGAGATDGRECYGQWKGCFVLGNK